MNERTKKLVLSALFAALIFVATAVVKIPSPSGGYVNLGDCIIIGAALVLPPLYGAAAAAIGACIADITGGFAIYAPATFVIKALMSIAAYYMYKSMTKVPDIKPVRSIVSTIIAASIAELVMVGGYYIFEGFLYGFLPAAANILPNVVQGIVAIILGTLFVNLLINNKAFRKYI